MHEPHVANVAFAFVEPIVACGELYCPTQPLSQRTAPTEAAVTAGPLWPDGVAFNVWHCDDPLQSSSITQAAANTREGPRLHLVCVDVGQPIDAIESIVATTVEQILVSFPGDYIQVRGLRFGKKSFWRKYC